LRGKRQRALIWFGWREYGEPAASSRNHLGLAFQYTARFNAPNASQYLGLGSIPLKQVRAIISRHRNILQRLGLRFGAAGLHQRDQLVAVMFELLVADAGNAAELL
jgi:hypothetical protein